MTIAELLGQSRAAHARYRQAQQVQKNQAVARVELLNAFNLRQQAQEEDPDFTDPAWIGEPNNFVHADLMAFYKKQLRG